MIPTLILSVALGFAGDIPARTASNPLEINSEMKDFLAQNIDRSVDSLQQVRDLVRIVFQENKLGFTYYPATRTAIETFTQRNGNCVSFTYLFIALARQLGLDARYREVDIVPLWSKIGNLVSLSGHANVAVFIGGRGYVVDLFPEVNRIELDGRVVSDARAIAHFYNNKGVDELGAGRPGESVSCFREALASDPSLPSVWGNLGVAQSNMGATEEAEKDYRKALELDPGYLVAMSNLAALFEKTGRYREAKSYLAKVRKFKLRNPYYHFSLGVQAYQSGAFRESIDHFRAALKLKPVEHNFDLAIAKAYAQLGQMDKATGYLKLAEKNAPDEASRLRYSEKLEMLAARLRHTS